MNRTVIYSNTNNVFLLCALYLVYLSVILLRMAVGISGINEERFQVKHSLEKAIDFEKRFSLRHKHNLLFWALFKSLSYKEVSTG